jgi:hypothetical protein
MGHGDERRMLYEVQYGERIHHLSCLAASPSTADTVQDHNTTIHTDIVCFGIPSFYASFQCSNTTTLQTQLIRLPQLADRHGTYGEWV